MFAKKALNFVLPVLLLIAAQSNAQVITSKKEAVKKGVYSKPTTTTESVSPDVKSTLAAFSIADKTTVQPKTVASVPAKAPIITPAKPAVKAVAQKSKSKIALIDDKDDPDLAPAPEENYVALQMINNAMTFIGTRYLGGGTSTSGMDCSGMVTAVYKIFDIKLPRSSTEMAKVGEKVENSQIKKGDLVFFHTNGKRNINHVGMVVEVVGDEIKFVHSSTHEGVIISSTKEPYYKKNFVQANRML